MANQVIHSTKRMRCFMIKIVRCRIRYSAHVYLLEEGEDRNDETEGEPTRGKQKRLSGWL
jgi:hypothetical protein